MTYVCLIISRLVIYLLQKKLVIGNMYRECSSGQQFWRKMYIKYLNDEQTIFFLDLMARKNV